jgi:Ca2+-binding EF-hand superfamily protein
MLIGYVEYELVDPKGPDLSSRALPRDPAAQFALLDRNRNGVIDRGEGGVLVERAFERADADGDGRVTRAEFEAFVSRRNRRN